MIIFWSLFGTYLYGVICFATALHRKGVRADDVSFWIVSILWPAILFFVIGVGLAVRFVRILLNED